jgi:hypothetical protein
MAGGDFSSRDGRLVAWHYVTVVCYRCGTMQSHRLGGEDKIGICRRCRLSLRDITDFDLWEPKFLQEKHPNCSDPWLIGCMFGDPPEDREEAEAIRYKCPACHEFAMTIVEGGCLWD